MKSQQPILTLQQAKNVHFGENCESGYSTTTSSEEGTLQRKITQANKAGFKNNTSFQKPSNMVSNGGAVDDVRARKMAAKHKKRSKNSYFTRVSSTSPSSSPYSSTSSLAQHPAATSSITQFPGHQNDNSGNQVMKDIRTKKQQRQIPPSMRHGVLTSSNDVKVFRHHKHMMRNLTRSQENLTQQSSMDEMTSSMEDLDFPGSTDELRHPDVMKQNGHEDIHSAAIEKFRNSMEQIKSLQSGDLTYLEDPARVDYYLVGNNTQNSYYDPLDISEHGKMKKQVIIATSPTDQSIKKPSPIRGILKNTKQSPQQASTSSTPIYGNQNLYNNYQLSKSEENLSSFRQITPPGMPVSPLSPGGRKSAFVPVKPRVIKRPTQESGPMIQVHPPVQAMVLGNGFESHLDQEEFVFPQHANQDIGNQTLQMQITPRSTTQIQPISNSVQYKPIRSQLPDTQAMISQEYNNVERVRNGQKTNRPRPQHQQNGRRNVNLAPEKGYHNGGEASQENSAKKSNNVVYIPARIIENGSDPAGQGNCGNCSNGHNREIIETEKSETPLPPAEILSNEAVRLKNFLETSNPEEIKQRLESLLLKKDPASIHAMSKLFPGSEFTADAAHCVRCHKDFNPRDPGRCILPHPERMVAKISQDEIGADFVCGCCNAGFRLIKMDFYEESTNAILTGHCYHGMHTTDPESVDYRLDGGSAKSCEEFGCVEFYV